MTNETLYDVLGDVNAAYVQQAHRTTAKAKKPAWVKWGAVAACLCLVAVVGIWSHMSSPNTFNAMLAEQLVDTTLNYAETNIGDRVAAYYEVTLQDADLEKYVGELYSQSDDVTWYYPKDTDQRNYLIREDADETLSLWKFSHFVVSDGETYTYGDVLSLVYGVESAKDIVSITSAPSNADNTDLGQKIQSKVGTHTDSDRAGIAAFYDIVKDVVCFGADSESVADENRFTYSFSTDAQDKLRSGESTYATRCLTVTLENGTTIDSWQYDALSGSFFEYGGIFTQPLPDESVSVLNQLFGIQ
jgi:hypothetical protein